MHNKTLRRIDFSGFSLFSYICQFSQLSAGNVWFFVFSFHMQMYRNFMLVFLQGKMKIATVNFLWSIQQQQLSGVVGICILNRSTTNVPAIITVVSWVAAWFVFLCSWLFNIMLQQVSAGILESCSRTRLAVVGPVVSTTSLRYHQRQNIVCVLPNSCSYWASHFYVFVDYMHAQLFLVLASVWSTKMCLFYIFALLPLE